MNPSNHFIYSNRRFLRADSPSDSNAYAENKYNKISFFIATFVLVDLMIILLVFVCKYFNRPHPSPDHPPTTPKPPSRFDILNAIPAYIYGTPALVAAISPSCSFEVENCVICLDEYVDGDCVRVLSKCKHMFHKDCIDQWLMVKSLHCPICRDRTIEQDVAPARTNCSTDPSSSMGISLPNHFRATAIL